MAKSVHYREKLSCFIRSVPSVALSKSGLLKLRISAANSSIENTSKKDSDSEDTGEYMAGKTVIVTGANTGMGLVTARTLAVKGAHVVLACRSEEKGKAAEENVWRAVKALGSAGSAEFAHLDLKSLSSVRQFAQGFTSSHRSLHCLINNAGIMIPPHSFTGDGFESQFQVNHLSHYLLTRLLLPTLLATDGTSSVIHISSLAGERAVIEKGEFDAVARRTPESYDAWTAYRQSKLAQVLFTVEMNRRLGSEICVNSVHPGIVNTDLFSRNMNSLVKALLFPVGLAMLASGAIYSAEKGASTALYLANSPPDKIGSGGYFADSAPKPANPVAFYPDLGKEWWEKSAEAVGLEA